MAPSALGYFDEDLFDRALRSAALEAESAASGVAVEEISVLDIATIPLPTVRSASPSPTTHTSSAPTTAPNPQAERGLKRKRCWGKYEQGKAWFILVQRKLLRGIQQRQAFREMREAKVCQMAEIVGGEISASLAKVRVKAEELARLVAEQGRVLEEQRRLVELKGMVEQRWRIAEASIVLPPPGDVASVLLSAEESANVAAAPAASPQRKKRARVEDSETAVEAEEVEHSRLLLVESWNTVNWGSDMFSVSDTEVGGAITKAPSQIYSVAPASPSVPRRLLPPQATVTANKADDVEDREEGEDLWGPSPEEVRRDDKEEWDLLSEEMRLGLENKGVCITYP